MTCTREELLEQLSCDQAIGSVLWDEQLECNKRETTHILGPPAATYMRPGAGQYQQVQLLGWPLTATLPQWPLALKVEALANTGYGSNIKVGHENEEDDQQRKSKQKRESTAMNSQPRGSSSRGAKGKGEKQPANLSKQQERATTQHELQWGGVYAIDV